MALTPIQEQALARWHELGHTTPTHPVLQMAYELYYQPMGVLVDALTYDALEALPNRNQFQIQLVSPRWSADKADRAWGQFNVIEPLVKLSGYLDPLFAPDGTISEFTILKDPDEQTQILIDEFQTTHAEDIFDLADTLSAACKLYIDAALESMIQDKKESSDLAQQFIENPRRYAALIFQLFTQPVPRA